MTPLFETTQWTLVLAARDGTETEARRALEALCRTYWYPIYAYLRSQGRDAEQAREETQAFFADLLGREWLPSIDRDKGRFRSFLLASLKNFLARTSERSRALKRGGENVVLSLDADEAEARFRREPSAELTPEQIYERRWGLAIMEKAMRRLEEESPSDRFEQFKPHLTGAGRSYREIANRLGTSEGAVKKAIYRLRRRYAALLRQEIAQTVVAEDEVDEELRHLLVSIRPWQT